MAYLDHNATSPLRPEARIAIDRALATGGNPSSVHASGRAARRLIEDARLEIASLVGARSDEVIFTSGGAEANALALAGAVRGAAEADKRITRLFVSAIEHDSVLASAAALSERTAGLRLEYIPVQVSGLISLDELRAALREGKGRALVALMNANNETGVVQPVSELVALVKEAGGLVFADSVQACGKIPLDFERSGVDYMSLSAHKLGGPQGCGALLVRDGAPFAPQIVGGGQEKGRRAGTENVAGIAGFGAAARAAGLAVSDGPRIAGLRDRFERDLKRISAEVVVFGFDAPRLGNTSNFAIPGLAAETAVMALDLDGVMISSGAACSSGQVRPSHVLAAMGVSESLTSCALRASFGWDSTDNDVDAAIASLSKLRTRVLARAAA
jgi:cysteine desulfurase